MSQTSSALRRPVRLAALAPWIALLVPLCLYNIGFRYVGSGDTAPAELRGSPVERPPLRTLRAVA